MELPPAETPKGNDAKALDSAWNALDNGSHACGQSGFGEVRDSRSGLVEIGEAGHVAQADA